jgi:hypothetical protein
MVSAFAIDSNGDVDVEVRADPRDRRTLEGVGMFEETLPCIMADRSRSAAIGEVNGR